ncbi:MAG: hypothetical protein LBI17_02720 [Rickettsiales bacterium]|jgi:hypothetical protein|nr:hypothetical protein [Rickettsiales bacterium]
MDFGFLRNIFRKKPTIADVLAALESFSPDQKSLARLSAVSVAAFGSGWRFNLEMYVSSLPAADREKYAPLVKNALSFDRALALWVSATQIVNGAKSLSPAVVRDVPEYEEYLPKFGIEGSRLLEKFRKIIGMKSATAKASDVPASGKILTKVSRGDLEEGVFDKNAKTQGPASAEPSEPAPPESGNASEPPEKEPDNAAESKSSRARRLSGTGPEAAAGPEPDDWEIGNFLRVREFLSTSREIMSAIVLDGKYKSLEDYPHYGFVLDAIRYLVSSGERILASKKDDDLARYFAGGRKEFEDMVEFYRNQETSEMAAPPESGSRKDDEASLGYVRVNQGGAAKVKAKK